MNFSSSCIRLGTALMLGLAAVSAQAEPHAVIGILNGAASLVRQATRFTLAEGAALVEGDILETATGAFAQVEFEDGAIVEFGEGSRALLKPRMAGSKAGPRVYLIEGWLKVTPPAKGEFTLLSPRLELGIEKGPVVLRLDAKSYAVFAERGTARLVQRDGARATVNVRTGEFAQVLPGADKVAVAPRMSAEFLAALPKLYRDPLPPRASLYAKRNPAPKPVGPVDYADVRPWIQSEPALRLPLNRQWMPRSNDKTFRAELVANLNAHREWERILFPERFLPKKPASAPASSPARTPEAVAAPASAP